MAHFQGLSYEDGDHALKAEFFEVGHVPSVSEAGEDAGEFLSVVGHFGAKRCFPTDEGRGVGKGKIVAVIVLGVAEAGDQVVDVADRQISIFL